MALEPNRARVISVLSSLREQIFANQKKLGVQGPMRRDVVPQPTITGITAKSATSLGG